MTTVTLYYSDNCSHCIKFKPTWNNFKKQLPKNIKTEEYENSKNSDIIEKNNIEYYPTIKINKNGVSYEYT